MCEERERLIGYVYDECDQTERHAIEAHLQSCPICRAEIGGLRKVRQDLLAWDVPQQPPVWRPAVPVPARVSPWSAIPAWAMTAAAGLLLMVGAAGGAVTYALLPARTVEVAAAPVASPARASAPSADAARIATLEQRLGQLEKTAAALQPVATRPDASELVNVKATVNSILRRMDDLDMTMVRTTFDTADVRREQQRLNFIMKTSLGAPTDAPGFGGAR